MKKRGIDMVDSTQLSTISDNEKLRAAYALNMCNVSVSQIVQYNDIYILEQEYNTILNNLNLQAIPKDEPLLNILVELLNTITFYRIQEIKKKQIEKKYQRKMKAAIWLAIPNISVIGIGSPLDMAVSLATQIGVSYMNYRKEKAEAALEKEDKEIELQITALEQFNALKRELFTTAWRLAAKYDFPDQYRLTERQIEQYNNILMDSNEIRKYARLEAIQDKFKAYPQFWYHLAHTACYISSSNDPRLEDATKELYRLRALEHFETFKTLNEFNILREDHIAASAALEHADLLIADKKYDEAKSILSNNIDKAGNSNDILQLFAMSYLKCGYPNEAIKWLKYLVVEDYNAHPNATLLSRLYSSIYRNLSDNSEKKDIGAEYNMLKMWVDSSVLFPLTEDEEASAIEYLDLANYDEYGNPVVRPESFEEIRLSSIIHIHSGTTHTFSNQNIHLDAAIHCEGTIEFVNCVIHYGEQDTSCGIVLSNTGSLKMKHCTIEGHCNTVGPIINAVNGSSGIAFEKCEFINCFNFLKAASDVSVEQCRVINPGAKFIDIGYHVGKIEQCEFSFVDAPDFIIQSKEAVLLAGDPQYCSEFKDTEGFHISECSFIGSCKVTGARFDTVGKNIRESRVMIKGRCSIDHSSFAGLYNICVGGTAIIKNSVFSHCFGIVRRGLCRIEECRFDDCSSVAESISKRSCIEHCQFNSCKWQLVSTEYSGGVKISFCEFNNWEAPIVAPSEGGNILFLHSQKSMLCFTRYIGSKYNTNHISNCVFNGMVARKNFLIEGRSDTKLGGHDKVVQIANTTFANCTTQRESKKIIKEYTQFEKLLSKKPDEQKVVQICDDCRGWNEVNITGGINENVVLKQKTMAGKDIGVSNLSISAGVLNRVVDGN